MFLLELCLLPRVRTLFLRTCFLGHSYAFVGSVHCKPAPTPKHAFDQNSTGLVSNCMFKNTTRPPRYKNCKVFHQNFSNEFRHSRTFDASPGHPISQSTCDNREHSTFDLPETNFSSLSIVVYCLLGSLWRYSTHIQDKELDEQNVGLSFTEDQTKAPETSSLSRTRATRHCNYATCS